MKGTTILQGVDVQDIIRFISSKNRKIQATFLSQAEELLKDQPEKYRELRKLFLDSSNGYMRAVRSAIFGDVEND